MALFNDNVRGLGFRTAGYWSARDLAAFAESVGQVYDALLVPVLRRSMLEDQTRYALQYLRHFERDLGPMYFEFLHAWWKYLERSGPELNQLVPGPWLALPGFQVELPTDRDIYESIAYYALPDQQLVVDRIRMSSPGGISFSGLGEIVEQFRGLIKDLWFRNRQERTLGELQIIEKYLSLQREYPGQDFPPPKGLRADRFLVEQIKGGVDGLKRLEQAGRIEDVGENIDERPE